MPTSISDLVAQIGDAEDFERARSAKRDIWKQVRHAGRPGADDERASLSTALAKVLRDSPSTTVGREVLWMLSEIGGDDCIGPMAALLKHAELREDARMALQRIPGDASLAALREGLESAPDDFQLNIAQSLRARGVEVPGLPCVKLKPVKPTQVKPVEKAT